MILDDHVSPSLARGSMHRVCAEKGGDSRAKRDLQRQSPLRATEQCL